MVSADAVVVPGPTTGRPLCLGKSSRLVLEELFSVPWNRAPTPTPVITRPVEVATIAPQLRSSPSAPLLNAASPGVPGPAFQFAQMPRDRPSSPQVQAPFLRGLSAAPQQCVFTQMPGPCRQRSAPVLLGAQQAPAVASASSGSAQVQQQYKDVSIRPPATPDRGSQTPVAVVRTTTPRSLHVQAQMPMRRHADGGLKPPPPGVTAPFATPDGISACSALPCRQQSAPILVAPPQVTVVTTTLPSSHASQPAPIPQGPWMSEQKSEEKKVKFSKGKDELVKQRRRRVLTGSCLAAWAAQWRASNRALLTTSSEQCRKLQEEVNQKSAAAQRAEAELTRRTEDEFRRLREVQTELSQLQQEAPALQARPQAQKVRSTLSLYATAIVQQKFKGVFKSDNVTINWKVSYCKPCEILKSQPSALNGTIKFDQLSKGFPCTSGASLPAVGLDKASTEDDVVHAPTLPNFGQALAQEEAEHVLSSLTMPYLRIPLLLHFLAADRLHALKQTPLGGTS
eukprot:g10422.t1